MAPGFSFLPAFFNHKLMNISATLLASHGTLGAIAAEAAALDLCTATGASLHRLLVVPDFWKGMMGDDWLNNAVTQARFGSYVENQLVRESAEDIGRSTEDAEKKGVDFDFTITFGKPCDCLLEAAAKKDYDLIVIGSPRPKGTDGYRSRMALDPLVRALKTRLMIIPHPLR